MHTTINRRVLDARRDRCKVFVHYSWTPVLILAGAAALVVVLVTALWQESTAVRVGGSLSVSIGGPISRTAFITVGIYAFVCAALIWPQFQERRRLS
jgi:ABC-type Fe3+-siderophore transport system permease subunit